MKKVLMFCMMFGTLGLSVAMAKEVATIKVLGNCGMCKSRIEKAAKEAGATTADWSEDTKILSVTFKEKKTSLAAIQQKIAAAGHDNGEFKTTSEVYEKLPGCCKYDRSGKSSGGGH